MASNADGQEVERMWVHRLKRGQNPAVVVHPALAQFLDVWSAWLDANLPEAVYLFPHPSKPWQALVSGENGISSLTHMLARVGGEVRPHGMRAFYVRVRRSQGADDLTISIELGQGSGPNLVRNVYGDPQGLVGDGRFTFLPKDTSPAWEQLHAQIERPANVVNL